MLEAKVTWNCGSSQQTEISYILDLLKKNKITQSYVRDLQNKNNFSSVSRQSQIQIQPPFTWMIEEATMEARVHKETEK